MAQALLNWGDHRNVQTSGIQPGGEFRLDKASHAVTRNSSHSSASSSVISSLWEWGAQPRGILETQQEWLGKRFSKDIWAEWEFRCTENSHLHPWAPQVLRNFWKLLIMVCTVLNFSFMTFRTRNCSINIFLAVSGWASLLVSTEIWNSSSRGDAQPQSDVLPWWKCLGEAGTDFYICINADLQIWAKILAQWDWCQSIIINK